MDEFRQLAIQRHVKSLFEGRHFSICAVDELAELLSVPVDSRIRLELKAYHCVNYSVMSDREKQLIQEKVVQALRGDPILNPARVLSQLTDEGADFAFTEDRYLGPKRIN